MYYIILPVITTCAPPPSKLPSCAPLVVVCAILARTFSGMVLWMDVGVIMFVNDLHIFLCVCVDTMYFFFIRVCVQCIKLFFTYTAHMLYMYAYAYI